MAYDILRFNRLATRLAHEQIDAGHQYKEPDEKIANFLERHRFSQSFKENYFLPMIGAIWSCSVDQMLAFPIQTMVRFCHNHGLLQIQNRPQWLTIKGGSREYVKRIVAALEKHRVIIKRERVLKVNTNRDGGQVEVIGATGTSYFDEVIMACHSDQTLDLVHGHRPTI
ncbi:hypothetical protein [Polynucleobacter necessarius]|uniref:hypothetical protein n=1 Tax=Polynucleobacter necessarius TaxID=576610 RepID=UPI001E43A296|nr:hypothetical protein [Polynucleobacter necessarius]